MNNMSSASPACAVLAKMSPADKIDVNFFFEKVIVSP
jgi:hypothetical protein